MILVISLIIPLILLYLLHIKIRKPSKTLVPPGPPGLPLIGNLHQLATASSKHIYRWQLSKKYGPIIHMKLGSMPLLVISSAKLAKEVMKTQDLAFCSRPKLLGQQILSYNGSNMIFSPYDDYWREVRKLTVIHLFSLKKVQSFRGIWEDEISRLVTKISGSTNQVINLSEMAVALGSTLTCRVAFSKRYDEHGSERRRFDDLLNEIQAMSSYFYVSDFFPRFGWVDKLTGLSHRLNTIFKTMDEFYQELLDDHLYRRKKENEEGDDILDILIHLKQHKTCSVDFNWVNIKALLRDIFVAGTGSASTTIIWTMTVLIKAPNLMQKAQAEIRNLIGKKGKVDEDDLPKLPYLKAVISETLRLYPPAPVLIRETLENCILEGYEIQPKTTVHINVWALARDPDYWANPDEFLPERFLNSDIDIMGHDFGVLPFGSGRRSCPAKLMGLVNVELAVANLLYAFNWELPTGTKAQDVDTDVLPGMVVHKKNPLLLVPKKYVVG